MEVPMPTGSATSRPPRCHTRYQSGVSYLWVIVTVALLTLASALATTIYATDLKREREAELIRVGREFRAALIAYYHASPGGKQFPRNLEDLLRDPRSPAVKRYLRKIHLDPITGKPEWGVVRLGDQIIGVHSLSDREPLKMGNFDPEEERFTGAKTYSEWVFLAEPPDAAHVKGPAVARLSSARADPTGTPREGDGVVVCRNASPNAHEGIEAQVHGGKRTIHPVEFA